MEALELFCRKEDFLVASEVGVMDFEPGDVKETPWKKSVPNGICRL